MNFGLDSVSIIDTDRGRIIETVDVGENPIGITFNGNKAWIANFNSRFVTIIDSENFLARDIDIPDRGVSSIEFG